jgi:hypothetical protein
MGRGGASLVGLPGVSDGFSCLPCCCGVRGAVSLWRRSPAADGLQGARSAQDPHNSLVKLAV